MTSPTTDARELYARGEPIQAPVLYVALDFCVRDKYGTLRDGVIDRLLEWKGKPHARCVGVAYRPDQSWREIMAGLIKLRRECDGLWDALLAPHLVDPFLVRDFMSGSAAHASQMLRSKLSPDRLHPDYPAGHSIISMPARLAVIVSDAALDHADRKVGIMWGNEWRAGKPYPMPRV